MIDPRDMGQAGGQGAPDIGLLLKMLSGQGGGQESMPQNMIPFPQMAAGSSMMAGGPGQMGPGPNMMGPGPGMMSPPDTGPGPLPFNLLSQPFPENSMQEPAPQPPDLNTIISDALEEVDFYRPQKERMYLDDKLYQMDDPYREDKVLVDQGTKDVGEFAALNDLRVIADKFGNRIGRQEPVIQVPGRDVDDTEDAQDIENYLRWIWKFWSQAHTLSGGKMPLLRQEVMSAVVRGWVCYRVWYDPSEEDDPFQLSLFDPMYVYPRFDKKGIKRVLVVRDMTIGEVIDDYPEFTAEVEAKYTNKTTGSIDRRAWVSTIAVYDRFYHGFIMDNAWVKKPTAHGMNVCPWVCVPNQGGIFEAPYGEGNSNTWTQYYGDSIYAPLRDPFRVMVRLYSALMTQVAKDANPPLIITTRNNNVEASSISTGIGGVNVVNDGDAKVFPIAQSQRPGLIETAVGGVKGGMAKGSLPDISWGQDMNTQAGYARSILTASAEDVFSPIINSIQIARAAISEIVLKVVKQHEIQVPMVSIKKGVRVQGQRFSFESVVNNGTYVEFIFQTLTPQDMIAMGSLVVNLVRGGIISMETAMGDKFLALTNPSLETERKIKEKALFDPKVMEILIDYTMSKNPDDPLSQAWEKKKLEEKMQQVMATIQGQMGGGAGVQGAPGKSALNPGGALIGGQRQGLTGTNTVPRQNMQGSPNPTLDMAKMANADLNTQG